MGVDHENKRQFWNLKNGGLATYGRHSATQAGRAKSPVLCANSKTSIIRNAAPRSGTQGGLPQIPCTVRETQTLTFLEMLACAMERKRSAPNPLYCLQSQTPACLEILACAMERNRARLPFIAQASISEHVRLRGCIQSNGFGASRFLDAQHAAHHRNGTTCGPALDRKQ